jgi:hypothetical protein
VCGYGPQIYLLHRVFALKVSPILNASYIAFSNVLHLKSMIILWGFHYMTVRKSSVRAELVYVCSLLHAHAQRHKLKTLVFNTYVA